MNLFVDCDDTLLLYDNTYTLTHPYGVLYGVPYRRNDALIERIEAFQSANPTACITIWSGGGYKYAERVGKLLKLEHIDAVYLAKDSKLPTPHDIVVDDDSLLPVECKIYTPFEEFM